MHGRSRMTIDPRVPTLPRTEHVGFSPTRQALLAPTAKLRDVFGEPHERGGGERPWLLLLLLSRTGHYLDVTR